VARTWRRARARSGVAGWKQFVDAVFKIVFLWIPKLKCTLQSIAKLKIKDPSSTIAKAGRGFIQGIEQEQHANLGISSAWWIVTTDVQMQNSPSFTPNFKCHSTTKLCALTFYTFSLWAKLKCLGKFWRTPKVLEWHQWVKGDHRVLS
jgi:hypothetical protein